MAKLLVSIVAFLYTTGISQAQAVWCWPINWATTKVLESPNELAVLPEASVGSWTPIEATRREVHDGKSYLFGNIHYKGNLGVFREDAVVFEEDWACDYPIIAKRTPTSFQREQIAYNIERTIFDPYSLRAVGISDITVMKGPSGQEVLSVCLEFNAKNRFGAYIGLTTTGYVFREDGTLFRPVAESKLFGLCDGIEFVKFEELEALGN